MTFDPWVYGERRTTDGRSFFVPVFAWLRDVPGVTEEDAVTYGVLVSFAGSIGCRPSMQTIASRLGCQERAARRRVARLRALGLVASIDHFRSGRQGQASNEYVFLEPPPQRNPRSSTPPGNERPPVTNDPTPRSSTTLPPGHVRPEPPVADDLQVEREVDQRMRPTDPSCTSAPDLLAAARLRLSRRRRV